MYTTASRRIHFVSRVAYVYKWYYDLQKSGNINSEYTWSERIVLDIKSVTRSTRGPRECAKGIISCRWDGYCFSSTSSNAQIRLKKQAGRDHACLLFGSGEQNCGKCLQNTQCRVTEKVEPYISDCYKELLN
jgi:hypothetical protein